MFKPLVRTLPILLLFMPFALGCNQRQAPAPNVVVQDDPPPVKTAAQLVSQLIVGDADTRRAAAIALGRLTAPDSEAAVPALLEALKSPDPEVRGAATYALICLGADPKVAVPALKAALLSNLPPVEPNRTDDPRLLADSRLLATFGSKFANSRWSHIEDWLRLVGGPAVPVFATALHDPDPTTRRKAAYALWWMAGNSTVSRPIRHDLAKVLTAVLQDPGQTAEVREFAASGLGQLGEAGVPGLLAALKDKSPAVRRDASRYLQGAQNIKDAPARLRAVADLIDAARDGDATVRAAAADSLAKVRPVLPEVVAELTARLRDPHADVRSSTVAGFGAIGEPAAPAVPLIVEILKKPDGVPRERTIHSLWSIGPGAKAAVPALVDVLKDRDATREELYATLNALVAVGAGDPHAYRAVHSFQTTNEILRREYTNARYALSPPPPEWLVRFLSDPNGQVASFAAYHLRRAGSDAVSALVAALKVPGTPDLAIEILGQIGPGARSAIPGLSDLYWTASREGRVRIASVLIQICSPAYTPLVAVAGGTGVFGAGFSRTQAESAAKVLEAALLDYPHPHSSYQEDIRECLAALRRSLR